MRFLIYSLLIITSFKLFSCSAGLLNSTSQLYGSWVSRLSINGNSNFGESFNSEFIFKQDSFFVEIVKMHDDPDDDYLPYKAKGIYSVSGDKINFNGVYKPEGAAKFNYPYEERFEYSYDSRILTLRSLSNPYHWIYSLIKRYPDGH